MTKKYKLLKDLPETKAGAIFTFCDDNSDYLSDCLQFCYSSKVIENNPEWFELVCDDKEIEEKWEIFRKKIFCVIKEFEDETSLRFKGMSLKEVKFEDFCGPLVKCESDCIGCKSFMIEFFMIDIKNK